MVGLFLRFLRFGFLAFGGPVAQISMLRRELVDEEQWVSSARFNRLLAVYQALPGPEAHELAVHLGMVRGGRLGGLLAGLGFMLPGFVLVLVLATLYLSTDLGQPIIAAMLLGIQLAVIALLARAVQRIGKHILVDPWTWGIAVGAVLATFARVPFWIVLPLSGLVYAAVPALLGSGRLALAARTLIVICGIGAVAAFAIALASRSGAEPGVLPPIVGNPIEPTSLAIFATGLKAGLLTFGGAYTAIPFVRADAVGGGWVTDPQFLDSLALSGVLPAPFIIFGTFVGFLAGGLSGGIAMTVGIFLPAFAFTLVLGDRIEAVVERPGLHRALGGVAAGVVGIIVVTAVQLAGAVAVRVPAPIPGLAIFGVALAILVASRSKLTVPAVLAGAAIAGALLFSSGAASG